MQVVGRAYYQRKLDELKVQIDPKIENKTNHHGIAFITFEEPDDAERLSYKWKGEKDEAKTKRYVPKMAAHPQNIHWDNLGVLHDHGMHSVFLRVLPCPTTGAVLPDTLSPVPVYVYHHHCYRLLVGTQLCNDSLFFLSLRMA